MTRRFRSQIPGQRAREEAGELKLVSDETYQHPSSEAQQVIERLISAGLSPGCATDVRRQYARTRQPLLAPLEAVSGITCWAPPGPVPTITIFRPHGATTAELLPGLVYLHGGGWTVGDLQTYQPLCRQLANATRCAIIWIEYRLAPEHPFPAAYDDTLRALKWVRENHAALFLDRTRIGIAGDSSGGNLAAAACLAERNDPDGEVPWVQILLYPCLDFSASLPSHRKFATGYVLTAEIYRWYRNNYAASVKKPSQWRLSPLFAPDLRGLPPTVILYAGFDPLRDEAACYADRLYDADVDMEAIYFPDMIHGFLNMGGAISTAQVAIKRIATAIHGLTSKPRVS